MNPDWNKPENQVQFQLLNDPLEQLVEATINRIRREWPTTMGDPAHTVPFQFLLKHAFWVYRASRFLAADIPKDPLRRPELALALAPLSRTILDAIFNVVFIFDDYPARLCWYLDSGLKEVDRKYELYASTYAGARNWTDWLSKFGRAKQVFIDNRDTVCAPKMAISKGRFPHPGAILSRQTLNDPTLHLFLTYLSDWFYKELSSVAHSHWSGLVLNIGQVLRVESGTEEDLLLNNKYRSDVLLQEMTFLLCLTSEIITEAGFAGRDKALYIWGLLTAYSDEANYLRDQRYKVLLS